MDIYTVKNLGGIGAVLMFISFLPFVGTYSYGILGLIGLILVMIAAKGLADYYREDGIFNNALYGVIAVIVGGVLVAALAFFAFVNVFSGLGLTLSNVSDWQAMFTNFSQTQWMDAFFSAAGYLFLALAVLFIFVVVAAVLFRKSMLLTSRKSGVGLFGTAGTIVLIGGVLTIIAIGLLLLWISLLLVAIAFFELKPQQSGQQTAQAPPPMQA